MLLTSTVLNQFCSYYSFDCVLLFTCWTHTHFVLMSVKLCMFLVLKDSFGSTCSIRGKHWNICDVLNMVEKGGGGMLQRDFEFAWDFLVYVYFEICMKWTFIFTEYSMTAQSVRGQARTDSLGSFLGLTFSWILRIQATGV